MKNLIKKIWNWVVSIPADKLLHLLAGLLINAYAFGIAYRIIPFWWAILVGLVIALGGLIAKEVYDYKHKEQGHSVEVADVLYGLGGVALIDLALIIALA